MSQDLFTLRIVIIVTLIARFLREKKSRESDQTIKLQTGIFIKL